MGLRPQDEYILGVGLLATLPEGDEYDALCDRLDAIWMSLTEEQMQQVAVDLGVTVPRMTKESPR